MATNAASISVGRFVLPASRLTCNCSSNPSSVSGPSCSYTFGAWANAFHSSQGVETQLPKCFHYQLSRSYGRPEPSQVDLGALRSDRIRASEKPCSPLRVANPMQDTELASQLNDLQRIDGEDSENGSRNGAAHEQNGAAHKQDGAAHKQDGAAHKQAGPAHKQVRSRVEWWRIDARVGYLASSERAEAGPSHAEGNGATGAEEEVNVAGPRPRRVGWIREEHSEDGVSDANSEELWTWQASTQTLHLNGTAMHGRLPNLQFGDSWGDESEEIVVSSQEVTGTSASGGFASRSVTVSTGSVGSENGASVTESSRVWVEEASSSEKGHSENGHSGNGHTIHAENGHPVDVTFGGSLLMGASEAAVAEVQLGEEAGSKKKSKKERKKKKGKAGKAALEPDKKKKGKKKKGKEAGAEEIESEVVEAASSSFVDVNGMRMYPSPGYIDRMEGRFSDFVSRLADGVKVDKKAEKAAMELATAEKTPENGAVKTEPPAENLEQRLKDLRRKAVEHKERHSKESGTLLVPTKQPILVLMRHGQSMWNELKLFTGDVDIPLTEKGVMEALSGGRTIKDVDFDIVFTSRLLRAKQTAMLALTQNSSHVVPVLVRGGYYGEGRIGDGNRLRLREAAMYALDKAACKMVPVFAHPALNERCYGDLQGLNKEEAAKEFGKELVQQWRRSNNTSPPGGESLVDTAQRARKYYVQVIEPRLREGKNVLVVTHGNVMRGLIAHLANLEEEEMLTLEISTAFPYAYAFSRESDSYAQCCLMKPMEDFITGEPLEDKPMGLASVLKKKNFDSLI